MSTITPVQHQREDLTGRRFNRLIVVEFSHLNPNRNSYWRCRCDCGTERIVCGARLKNGTTRSCGCLQREVTGARVKTHGNSAAPEYRVWNGLIDRCENPNNNSYHRYGGRGITVCPRWRESFEAFYADMGPRPSPRHQLDRKDNEKGYEPGNCRWATKAVQANNTRSNRRLTVRGETKTLAEWASVTGHPQRRVWARLRLGWSPERALGM